MVSSMCCGSQITFLPTYAQYIHLDSMFSRSPMIRFPGSIPPSMPIEPQIHILKSREWFDCIVSLHSLQCAAFLTCTYSTPPYLMKRTILCRLTDILNANSTEKWIRLHSYSSLVSSFLLYCLYIYSVVAKRLPYFMRR